ncbi:MAG TPA: HIT domain-containing protein [Candidatus Nanopelagicaceae bacterium]|nr:HIT domain-containing protein [Candidatus Nanopelagicaceae bacterium]
MQFDGVGVPDAWQRIWAPHRMAYIQGENRPKDADDLVGCPFCRIPTIGDDEALIVARGSLAYVVLNLYPYNAGHTLICTYRHVADYTDLTDEEVAEIGLLTQRTMRAIRSASGAQGFNLGINQGGIAGAGIAAHFHQHVVPRWGGDANFMPIIGQTKILPEMLSDTRALIAAHWS